MNVDTGSKKNHYSGRFNSVFDYIDRNIDNNITLDDLASTSNFSKFHFSRLFHAMYGEKPYAFIQRVRLERAKAILILDPDEKIADIGYRCGYNDISVFTRQFKNYFGVAPSSYRNEKIKNSNNS